jgi:tetratricopeptide (TPR) repeat protein
MTRTTLIAGILLFASALFSQNTIGGEAKIVPEAEVERQSAFVDAEKERLLGHYDKAVEAYKQFLRKNQNHATAWYGLSRTYQALDDANNALDAIGKAITADQENEWYRILQADLLEKNGRNKDAAAVYEELARRFPDTPEFLDRLAYLHVLAGDPKAGLKALDRLEKLRGINEETAYGKHLIYVALGDNKKAAGEIEKLIKVFPDRLQYQHRLAEFHTSTGNKEAARKVYANILRLDPSDPVARLATVEKTRSGDDVAYLRSLDALFTDPNVSIDAKIKELTPFLAKMQQESNPAIHEAMLELGRKAEIAHPNSAKAWALSGDIAYLAGNIDEALARYRRCLALDDSVYSVWENILTILFQKGDYRELYTFSEKAMDDFPNQPASYYYFGRAAIALGRPTEAMNPLDQALLMSGRDPVMQMDINVAIADALLAQKEYAKAAQRLESLLEKGGNQHPGILERYGDAQFLLGQTAKALDSWQQAFKLNPSPALKQKISDKKL